MKLLIGASQSSPCINHSYKKIVILYLYVGMCAYIVISIHHTHARSHMLALNVAHQKLSRRRLLRKLVCMLATCSNKVTVSTSNAAKPVVCLGISEFM